MKLGMWGCKTYFLFHTRRLPDLPKEKLSKYTRCDFPKAYHCLVLYPGSALNVKIRNHVSAF